MRPFLGLRSVVVDLIFTDKLSMRDRDLKRKFPRREVHKKVGVLAAGVFLTGFTLELGEGGTSIETEMVLTEGREVVLSFQIPKGSFVSVRALVKSTKSTGATVIHGLSFVDIPFLYKRQIRSFVSSLEQYKEFN